MTGDPAANSSALNIALTVAKRDSGSPRSDRPDSFHATATASRLPSADSLSSASAPR